MSLKSCSSLPRNRGGAPEENYAYTICEGQCNHMSGMPSFLIWDIQDFTRASV